jgi:hypothetical protein
MTYFYPPGESPMLKTLLIATALLSQAALCLAQTEPASAPANPHRAHDQKLLGCRQQAESKGLQAQDRADFISQCMKAS